MAGHGDRLARRHRRGCAAAGHLSWGCLGCDRARHAGRCIGTTGRSAATVDCLLAFTVNERASRVQWIGLTIGFAGVALVLSDRLTLAGVEPLALAVNLLALAGITAGTLYQKKHAANVDLRTGSLIQFAASFVLLLLPFAIATETMVVDYTLEFWLALGWSIVALSLVAITLLLVMIRRGRATEVTSLMYLTPPSTAVLAWLMFGEMLGPLAWAGVLVTMAGVALVLTAGR